MTRSYRFWTDRELLFVSENYIRLGPQECAKNLRRPTWSIHTAAMRLGLSDPDRQKRWRSKINRPEKDPQASEKYGVSVFRVYLVGNKKFALVDERDLPKVLKHRWRAFKPHVTCYAYTSVKRDVLYLHNLIVPHKKGIEIDHRNHDGLDNVRQNLRKATRCQNGSNRGLQKNNTTGYKGVYFCRSSKRWYGKIGFHSRMISLGYFNTPIEAAKAYNKAALRYHGDFAHLNKI